MKFLIISENGCPALTWKLQLEGHEVLYFVKNNKNQLSGMVQRIDTIKNGINAKPDVVVIDGNLGVANLDEELRGFGCLVVGGSDWGNKLIFDAKFSAKAMESFSIRTPGTFSFSSVQMAMEFVEAGNKPYRLECDGYYMLPKNKSELLAYMNHIAHELKYVGKCVLKEIVYGSDVAIELWYSHGIPLAPPFTKIDTNTLMTGDAGPQALAQTSVCFTYPTRQPKLVQESLKKIQIFLEKTRYTGFLSLYGTVRKGKFYVKSFSTCVTPATLAVLNEPLGELLWKMAFGHKEKIAVKQGFGYAMRVTLHPYPTVVPHKSISIENVDWKIAYPTNVWLDQNTHYTCGTDVLYFTGFGDSCFDAEKMALEQFRKLSLANKQARIGDGAKIAMRRMDDLSRQGYEMPPFIAPVKRSVDITVALVQTSV